MSRKRNSLDMVNGPLGKNILLFSVPLIFSQTLQILFNSADTIIVGKFAGDSALAAVGATGSIVFLLTSLFSGLATGSNVVIARFLGLGQEERISSSVHSSILMAILSGVFLTFFGFFFSRTFLALMSTPEVIIDDSARYMRIYFLGVIFLLLYDFGAAVLRSKGDTKRPLYFLFLSGIVNVLLNLLTVIVLHLSVVGVALATVVSEALSAFLVLRALTHEEGALKLEWKKLSLDREISRRILQIGIPAGLSGVVFSLSNVVIQSSINSFDSTVIVAGNAAGSNIEGFVYIGYTAFSQATITFTSQCIGARRYDRIRPIMLETAVMVLISAVLMSTLVYVFSPQILTLYTKDPAVIETGVLRTYYVARLLVLNGLLDVFVNSMRGMGYSGAPTLIMVAGICGVRLAWLFTVFPMMRTLDSIYMCYPVSWIVTMLIELFLWLHVYRKEVIPYENREKR